LATLQINPKLPVKIVWYAWNHIGSVCGYWYTHWYPLVIYVSSRNIRSSLEIWHLSRFMYGIGERAAVIIARD
jgi:hypothetical protein